MLIYLYGKDSYRRQKKLSSILDSYKKKHQNSDVETFNLEEDESEWQEAKDFLRQPSMFSDSKIVVVKEGTKVDKKSWTSVLKEYKDKKDAFILITDSSKKPKKKFKFLIEEDENIRSQKFKELKGKSLKAFVYKLFKEEGVRLDKKAESFFLSYLEAHDSKSWLAVNEIKKISLSGFDNPVSLTDVEKLISWIPKGKMFNETRKLFRSGASPGLKLPVLEKLISRNESNPHVFNMLGVQAKGQSNSILADLDIKIKSGQLEYEEALLDFVLRAK